MAHVTSDNNSSYIIDSKLKLSKNIEIVLCPKCPMIEYSGGKFWHRVTNVKI